MPFGDLGFSGFWDAANNIVTSNAPGSGRTLLDRPSPQPVLYYVTVAGQTSLGGISDWQIGDWAVNFGWGWARFSGKNNPSFSLLYSQLNAALAAGVFPSSPGVVYSRLWLNGPGDGTGVLEYSGGVGPPPNPSQPGSTMYSMLNYLLAVGAFPQTPGGATGPRLWLNGSGDGTGILEYS